MSAKEGFMGNLHEKLAQKLMAKLDDPDITASELNVIRQFLKDSGIEAGPDNEDMAEIAELLKDMDFTGTDG